MSNWPDTGYLEKHDQDEGSLTSEEINREALRIANISRLAPRLRLLGTLNPQAQAHYRELAVKSLGARK